MAAVEVEILQRTSFEWLPQRQIWGYTRSRPYTCRTGEKCRCHRGVQGSESLSRSSQWIQK